MAIQRVVLSGSTNGRPLTVIALAASCGFTVHTAGSVTGADNVDEIWAWAFSMSTTTGAYQLNLQWGTTSTADLHNMTVARDPANPAPPLVAPGINLNNGLKLMAWASACNTVAIVGHAFQVRA